MWQRGLLLLLLLLLRPALTSQSYQLLLLPAYSCATATATACLPACLPACLDLSFLPAAATAISPRQYLDTTATAFWLICYSFRVLSGMSSGCYCYCPPPPLLLPAPLLC